MEDALGVYMPRGRKIFQTYGVRAEWINILYSLRALALGLQCLDPSLAILSSSVILDKSLNLAELLIFIWEVRLPCTT